MTAAPSSAAPLTGDRTQIDPFTRALFAYADDGTKVSLRSFRDDGEGPAIDIKNIAVTDDRALLVTVATGKATFAARHEQIAVFAPPIATFHPAEDGSVSASMANLANGLTISVECDQAPAAARQKLEALLGPPTAVVRSGGQWIDPETGEVEDKLHLHWRLTEPTREPADHERLRHARALACRLVGGDPTSASPVHPMRWPGSWHRKAAPRLCSIDTLHADAEIDLGDAIDRLADACGALTAPDERRPAPAQASRLALVHGPTADALDVATALAAIPNADLAWDDWNRIAMATWRATSGSEEGFAAFAAWSSRSEKNDPTETRRRWDHLGRSPPTQLGAGTLFRLAQEHRPGWVKPTEAALRTEPQAAAPEQQNQPAEREIKILRADEFLASLVMPSQVIDGVLSRGYLYTLTGPTGAGKTTIATQMALSVAAGRRWAGRETEQGNVLFLAGENPTDAGLRFAATRQRMGIGDDDFRRLLVIADAFDIEKKRAIIQQQAEAFGNISLAIVDTAAAFFQGDDENANAAMRQYASTLRSLVSLPGNPAVLVPSHPTKNASRDNLQPRGGGAFIAEVDGNLTLWKDEGGFVSLHHNKLRGVPFDPIQFQLETVAIEGITDAKNRKMFSVVASFLDEQRAETMKDKAVEDRAKVLRTMQENPGATFAAIAEALGWRHGSGKLATSRVDRAMAKLDNAKLVKKNPTTDRYAITKAGREAI